MSNFIDIFDLFHKSKETIKDWRIIRVQLTNIESYINIPSLNVYKPYLNTALYESKRSEMIDWLDKNTTDKWTVMNYFSPEDTKTEIGFKSVNDAIRFKLTFQ